ncbi:hypothetical protein RFI_38255, partial [Reticulomyxa filosa]
DTKIIELTNDIQQVKSEMDKTITQFKRQTEQCQNTCDTCMKLNDELKHLKSEKEINEKKQSEEISKMNSDNKILKQQLVRSFLLFLFYNIKQITNYINQDIILTEIKQLKKEIQFKNNQIHHIDEDKKENDSNNQLFQTKHNPSSKFNFDLFCSSSRLINTFTEHTMAVWNIDYSTFDDCQFICSGSHDNTVRVWDIDNNKQIQSFNEHSSYVFCVKFSSYHYHNHRQN